MIVICESTEVGNLLSIPIADARESLVSRKYEQGEKTIVTSTAAILQMPEQRGSAVIGKSVTITGQVFSHQDLTIDAEVDGSVELQDHHLTVGPNGKLRADVRAARLLSLDPSMATSRQRKRSTLGNRPGSLVIS